MKDRERDILRRKLLELLSKDIVRYTALEKEINALGLSFATSNTFKSQLHYLLNNGYIFRASRGVYKITQKGKKYLVLLAF
jgi:DNA-binding PadR family transcriptional regulator